jgi:hypothetical protein
MHTKPRLTQLRLSSRKKLKWLVSLSALFFIPLLMAGQCAKDLPPTAVKITSFTASPTSLPATGGNITLSWTTEGATTLSIDQEVGTVTGTSVVVNNVTTTKTFTLTASKGTEKVTATTTAQVGNSGDKDTTPPQTVSLTPENGSKDVSVGTPIVVVFSEAIKADTVTDSSVKVTGKGGSSLDKSLELSGDGKTLTINLLNSIEAPSTVTIGLESTLTDVAGNALATTPWSFEIPFWLTISNALDVAANNVVLEPSIAVGDNGNLVVAWYEWNRAATPIQTHVYVKQWDGKTWTQLGDALNTASTNSASEPSLVLDSQNRPIVAFREDGVTGERSIYVKRWNGSTWITVGAAVTTGLTEHPSLALGDSDAPSVAFTKYNGTNDAIFFKTFNGTLWQQLGGEIRVDKNQDADYASLAMLGNTSRVTGPAVPLVAFQETDSFSNNIYVKQWSEMANAWLKLGDQLDIDLSKEAQRPSLRLFGAVPFVAWQEEGSTNGDIYVKSFNGTTWDMLGDDDYKTQDSSEPFIATARDGFTIRALVWQGSDSNGQNVYAKVFDETSGGWSPLPPTGLEPFNTPGKAAEHPEMTFGSSGAYVAFAEFDSTTNSTNLVVKRYNSVPSPEPQ